MDTEHDPGDRHDIGTGRHVARTRRYTAWSLTQDKIIDAVLRVVEAAPIRIVLLALSVLVAADLAWRVLLTTGVCR